MAVAGERAFELTDKTLGTVLETKDCLEGK